MADASRNSLVRFVLAELAVFVTYTCYLYMPFAPVKSDEATAVVCDACSNITAVCQQPSDFCSNLTETCMGAGWIGDGGDSCNVLAGEKHTVWFKVLFYLGLGVGSIVAGSLATRFGPLIVSRCLGRSIVVATLLLSYYGGSSILLHHFLWFAVAFCAMGIFAVGEFT